jgi:hypothetical protein
MKIPGFEAEASIYRSSNTYRNASYSGAEVGRGVAPQLREVCTGCVWNTYDFPTPTCAKLCREIPRPGQPLPQEYPVECDPSECPARNCCPPGCVNC